MDEYKNAENEILMAGRNIEDPAEDYLQMLESGIVTKNGMAELIASERLSSEQKKKILISIGDPSKAELNTWVKIFYNLQNYRKASANQIRSMIKLAKEKAEKEGRDIEIHDDFNKLILNNASIMEKNLSDMLTIFVTNDVVGRWLLKIVGVGPILAANLLSTFDVEGRQYASQFHSYCGMNDQKRPWLGQEKSKAIVNDVLKEAADKARRHKMFTALEKGGDVDLAKLVDLSTDEIWVKFLNEDNKFKPSSKTPTLTTELVSIIAERTQWKMPYLTEQAYDAEKGTWDKKKLINACAKVPYNRSAKVLMYKLGQSFIWVSGKPESLYARLYLERKALETKKNEEGLLKEAAEQKLATTNIGQKTVAYGYYSKGMLPPGHIIMRSLRIAEKIFVCHLFEEMYRVHYDEIPPLPYILEHGEGHHDYIGPEVPYDLVTSEKS